jgi:hypothetical protein
VVKEVTLPDFTTEFSIASLQANLDLAVQHKVVKPFDVNQMMWKRHVLRAGSEAVPAIGNPGKRSIQPSDIAPRRDAVQGLELRPLPGSCGSR